MIKLHLKYFIPFWILQCTESIHIFLHFVCAWCWGEQDVSWLDRACQRCQEMWGNYMHKYTKEMWKNVWKIQKVRPTPCKCKSNEFCKKEQGKGSWGVVTVGRMCCGEMHLGPWLSVSENHIKFLKFVWVKEKLWEGWNVKSPS